MERLRSGRGGVTRHFGSLGRGREDIAPTQRSRHVPERVRRDAAYRRRRAARTARFWTVRLCRSTPAQLRFSAKPQVPRALEQETRTWRPSNPAPSIRAKLDAFLARAVGDLSAGYGGVMVSLGNRLGLYKAMAGAGPLSSRELASRAGCAERYVREWLDVAGRRRLRRLPRGQRHLRADAGAGLRPRRRGQPGLHPERLVHRRPRCGSTRTRRSRPSAPATASPGATMTGGSIAGSRPSTATPIAAASSRNGCRRSTASSRSSKAGALVADVGCGHGHSTTLMAAGLPGLAVPRLRHASGIDRRGATARRRGRR